ncbi:MAG: MipA/OmpV family protein [Roseibacillus sp.]
MKHILQNTVPLLFVLTSTPTLANEILPREGTANADERHWLVGGILVAQDSPYRDVSPSLFPIPYLAWETANLHLGTDKLQYDFLHANSDSTGIDFTLSLIADPRFGTPDPDDDSPLEELSRDLAFEAGLEATAEFGPLFLSSTTMIDLFGVHSGLLSTLEFGIEVPVWKGSFELSLATTYQSSDLSEYLYGVSAAEATADLTSYQPGDTWITSIEATYLHPLSDSAFLAAGLSVDLLNSAASDSPRLDDDLELQGFCGLIWKF